MMLLDWMGLFRVPVRGCLNKPLMGPIQSSIIKVVLGMGSSSESQRLIKAPMPSASTQISPMNVPSRSLALTKASEVLPPQVLRIMGSLGSFSSCEAEGLIGLHSSSGPGGISLPLPRLVFSSFMSGLSSSFSLHPLQFSGVFRWGCLLGVTRNLFSVIEEGRLRAVALVRVNAGLEPVMLV